MNTYLVFILDNDQHKTVGFRCKNYKALCELTKDISVVGWIKVNV